MSSDVDIIIPCYNGARYLAQTIDSVLAQEEVGVRILVVDDGSTDDSRAVVERYGGRVDYVYQDNRGQAAARNHGIRLTRNPFVCLLDADDILAPGALGLLREQLERDPELDVSHGKTLAFRGTDIDHLQAEAWRPFVAWSSYLAPFSVVCAVDICSAMFRRRVFDEHGLFPEERTIQGCEDWLLWFRAVLGGARLGAVDAVCLLYRQHAAASSALPDRIAARETEFMRRASGLFREHSNASCYDWAILDAGIRAVALRWLWLGDEHRYRELLAETRDAVPPQARRAVIDDAFERGAELGWRLLYAHLADVLLEEGEPYLAAIMLLKSRDLRALRRSARRHRQEALLDRVTGALAAFADAHAPKAPTIDAALPTHASFFGELYFQLGVLAAAGGQRAVADERFERALVADPNHALSHVMLSRRLLAAGKPRAAVRAALKGFSLFPERVLEFTAAVDPDAPILGSLLRFAASKRALRSGLTLAAKTLAPRGFAR